MAKFIMISEIKKYIKAPCQAVAATFGMSVRKLLLLREESEA